MRASILVILLLPTSIYNDLRQYILGRGSPIFSSFFLSNFLFLWTFETLPNFADVGYEQVLKFDTFYMHSIHRFQETKLLL